jgi:hypothetical protein
MQLTDFVSEEEKNQIDKIRAIQIGSSRIKNCPYSADDFLFYWNKNKKSLFRLLGNKSIISKTFIAPIRKEEAYHKIDIYLGNICFGSNKVKIDDNSPAFVKKALPFFFKKMNKIDDTFTFCCLIKGLFIPFFIYDNKLLTDYKYTDMELEKKFCFHRGEKVMRVLQKLNKVYQFATQEEFNEYREKISVLTSVKKSKQTVYISIHPLDFLTMSTTNSWSTCMNLNHGSYRDGVTEMMNSNMTVVAYTKTKEKLKDIGWNDKSWRCLFYINKDIILAGKEYPFSNDKLKQEILVFLKKLVAEKFGWNYKYGMQKYYDLAPLSGYIDVNSKLLLKKKCTKKDKHKILLYTNGCMYNDMAEDNQENYYCFRNYVKHTKLICVSGPAICYQCGKPLKTKDELHNKVLKFSKEEVDYIGVGDGMCHKCDDWL